MEPTPEYEIDLWKPPVAATRADLPERPDTMGLIELFRLITRVPKGGFRWAVWGSLRGVGSGFTSGMYRRLSGALSRWRHQRQKLDCNTAGCVAGWGTVCRPQFLEFRASNRGDGSPVVGSRVDPSLDSVEAFASTFGLPVPVARAICIPGEWLENRGGISSTPTWDERYSIAGDVGGSQRQRALVVLGRFISHYGGVDLFAPGVAEDYGIKPEAVVLGPGGLGDDR